MEIAVASTLAPLVPTAPAVPLVPDALATARFSELMQASPAISPTSAPVAVESTAVQQTPTTALSGVSLGDRILTGMQGVSSDFQSSWKSVAATLESGETLSTQDLLKLQLQLTQVSVQYDLVGKAISRSTQNFDQLVRVQ
jgi:type III secretion protein I